MTFVALPLELNAEAMIDAIFADMADRFPGWEPAAANPETWLIRSMVYRLVSPLAQVAVDVAETIFAEYGQQIAGVDLIVATPAQVASTWTMIDNTGYTIPADTQVNVPNPPEDLVGFRTLDDVVVPPGEVATLTGQVVLEAIEPGTEGNGLTGTAQVVDALVGPDTVTLVGSSSGGVDAEDPADYLNRLAATLQTFGPHPILARDAEILARRVPGVSRATALDMFDPGADDPNNEATWDSEKHLSIALQDADGQPLPTATKNEVAAELEAAREVNFVFHVIDPTYSTVNVNFQVVPMPGFAQADVEAGVIAALSAFLSPENWGLGDQADPTVWVNQRVIRYQDLVTVVNTQQGVDHYTVLKVAISPAALGTADVTMTGAAPLPQPGTIQVGS